MASQKLTMRFSHRLGSELLETSQAKRSARRLRHRQQSSSADVNRPLLSQLFRYLSRACLGKCSVCSSTKMACRTFPHRPARDQGHAVTAFIRGSLAAAQVTIHSTKLTPSQAPAVISGHYNQSVLVDVQLFRQVHHPALQQTTFLSTFLTFVPSLSW